MQFIIGLVLLAASFLLQSLLTKPKNPKPASISEFDVPQVDEGTPQAVFFGDNWTSDWTVLWYGNLRSDGIPPPDTSKKTSGGKGGGKG